MELLWPCVACGGDGERKGNPDCEECHGAGEILIDQCPHNLINSDTIRFLKGARYFEVGSLPVTGGWLAQCSSFMEALEYFQGQEARWKQRREDKALAVWQQR